MMEPVQSQSLPSTGQKLSPPVAMVVGQLLSLFAASQRTPVILLVGFFISLLIVSTIDTFLAWLIPAVNWAAMSGGIEDLTIARDLRGEDFLKIYGGITMVLYVAQVATRKLIDWKPWSFGRKVGALTALVVATSVLVLIRFGAVGSEGSGLFVVIFFFGLVTILAGVYSFAIDAGVAYLRKKILN